jgi:hypothetical protein
MKTKLLPKDPYGLVAFAEALVTVLSKKREDLGIPIDLEVLLLLPGAGLRQAGYQEGRGVLLGRSRCGSFDLRRTRCVHGRRGLALDLRTAVTRRIVADCGPRDSLRCCRPDLELREGSQHRRRRGDPAGDR